MNVPRVTPARLAALLALSASCLAACGGEAPEARAPIAKETPADEILRIGKTWTSTAKQRGLLSPPSVISVFEVREESTIELSPTEARESLVVVENIRLRTGERIACETTVNHALELRWGRREGEAVVELTRPPVSTPRVCDKPGHPEPLLERPFGAARFALRSDSLVAIEPATDDRVYLPGP